MKQYKICTRYDKLISVFYFDIQNFSQHVVGNQKQDYSS